MTLSCPPHVSSLIIIRLLRDYLPSTFVFPHWELCFALPPVTLTIPMSIFFLLWPHPFPKESVFHLLLWIRIEDPYWRLRTKSRKTISGSFDLYWPASKLLSCLGSSTWFGEAVKVCVWRGAGAVFLTTCVRITWCLLCPCLYQSCFHTDKKHHM